MREWSNKHAFLEPAFQDLPGPWNVLYEGMAKKRTPTELVPIEIADDAYEAVLAGITELLESARRAAARSVNSIMTETYWEVGRRIVEEEQGARPGRLRGASHRAIVPGPDNAIWPRLQQGQPETDAEVLQGMGAPQDWSDSV